jgi:hypothetical protein
MVEERRVIRASEIGEYGYCSRAWWYRHVVKLPAPGSAEQSGRFAAGREAHARHGRSVALSGTLRVLGIGLLLCGLAILSIILLMNIAR